MTRPTDRRQEQGMAAVFTVLGFLALTLVIGMSSDFGIFMRYRRAMQNACDSAALAGAAATLAEVRPRAASMVCPAVCTVSFTP